MQLQTSFQNPKHKSIIHNVNLFSTYAIEINIQFISSNKLGKDTYVIPHITLADYELLI